MHLVDCKIRKKEAINNIYFYNCHFLIKKAISCKTSYQLKGVTIIKRGFGISSLIALQFSQFYGYWVIFPSIITSIKRIVFNVEINTDQFIT
ncbi:hypothetical protein BpHYR1_000108 [Brachionus plicatilis]|uniref:Uncharacterized protein n=1 Tax=Brachionus plicatilis TaxID=10195 RepID=A0A3M7R261_BRAPC|nr:hypothetical protein BpHYR1_000108 [Brachionus plicatilis]